MPDEGSHLVNRDLRLVARHRIEETEPDPGRMLAEEGKIGALTVPRRPEWIRDAWSKFHGCSQPLLFVLPDARRASDGRRFGGPSLTEQTHLAALFMQARCRSH